MTTYKIPSPPPDIHHLCCKAISFIKGFDNEEHHFNWALENEGIAFILVDDSKGSGFNNPSKALQRGRTVNIADLLEFTCDPHFTRCVGIRLRKGETY